MTRTGSRTDSVVSDHAPLERREWTVTVAMNCRALAEPTEIIALEGVRQATIGRGVERYFRLDGPDIRLAFPDRWMSHQHARLVRDGDQLLVEDQRSTNGTRLNGEQIFDPRAVANGDVIQCGGTFLVVRHRARAPKVDSTAEPPASLRTSSPWLDHELRIMCKVAHSDLPILVLGESGTGKEVVARTIHSLSRREGPFVALNCGALPPNLVESELFGTRRGAFSGAEDRPGLVRSAEGGTLFLDEVAELSNSAQAALLRVLQEKEFIPLGARKPVRVDVRLVTATNRPIALYLADKRLRSDFYARLSNYVVRLPALRERREDLGQLVATLIARHSADGTPRVLSPAAALALFTYRWPLNIRELEQCVTAAVAVTESEIDVEHLPAAVRENGRPVRAQPEDERALLIARLRCHGGNLSAVARDLATTRSRLYRLLEKYAISRDGQSLR